MRSAQVLAQLALWTASTNAFHPELPPWSNLEVRAKLDARSIAAEQDAALPSRQSRRESSSSASKKAQREAARLANKYERRSATGSTIDGLEKRDNKFDIMEASDSGDKLTEGIDQDGTDYSYLIKVQLGSKGTELHMLVDTGAGSSWVMGSDCTTDACSVHDTFGSDDSDTFKDTGESFSVAYGSGHVKGTLAKDTISVAGVSFDYEFGVTDETSDDFNNFAFDGILGMAMTDSSGDNFLQSMSDAGEIDASVFGVALNRASDGKNNGEIKFGSPDDNRIDGDITYTDLGSDDNSWAIKMDDAAYDGKTAGVGALAYVDTGTTFIFGPKDMVKSMHSVIDGSQSSDGTTYTVPCDSDKSLTFTFSGTDFELSPKDWISSPNKDGSCNSNIYGQEVVKGSWLLGATFIKNVYAVFDKDKKRIGFAKQASSDSAESSASTTTTASSSVMTTSMLVTTMSANGTAVSTFSTEVKPTAATTTDSSADKSSKDSEDASTLVSASLGLTFTICIATVSALLI